MANIPANVILIWTGTNAAIPSGWERVTSLDGKFVKGAANGIDPNTTGGSDTHTHTSPVHTHSANSHRHYGSTTRDGAFETEGGGTQAARDSHYHDYDFTNITGGALNDAITYAAGDSKPPYHEVIFIRPAGGVPAPLSDGIVALYNKTSIPSGWQLCNGTASPDLRNKYLRGAGTGGDAGGTGGTLNHTHDVSHTHTARSHTHDGTTGWDSDQGSHNYDTWSGGGSSHPNHWHYITLNANTAEAGSAYSGTTPGTETVEPSYKKLVAMKNNTGGASKPKDIIALWIGTLATIPQGWIICDGTHGTPDMTGYYFKGANDTTELGFTGGSNTHTHAASNSHTHTAAGSHTHPSASVEVKPGQGTTTANSNGVVQAGHTHSLSTCSSATSSWNATTVSADSSNNEPAYRTVAFIMYKRELIGGLFFALKN